MGTISQRLQEFLTHNSLPHAPRSPTLPPFPVRWWRAFITSGASAFYMYGYSGIYFFTRLEVTMFTPALMYFSYMAIVAVGWFCLTGAVGFLTTYLCLYKMYKELKCD